MSTFHWVFAAVVVQRLLELVYAQYNTSRLMRRGAVEVGARHYPLFILLHGGWLAALAVTVPAGTPARPEALAAFGVLMAARIWILATLGPFWTTRIITLSGAPLVQRGPYRLLRHPNYWVVAGEIALLPLAFGATNVAIIFSILNGSLLAWRVAVEDRVISARGSSASPG